MPRESVKRAELDLRALESSIKSKQPERIEYIEVLEKMKPILAKQVAAGVSHRDLAEALTEHGVKVSPARLQHYLETGRLDAHRPPRPPKPSGGEAPGDPGGGDPTAPGGLSPRPPLA